MLEHLGGDDPVEDAVGEGQRQRVALHRESCTACGGLPLSLHRVDHVAHGLELAAVGIEGDDAGAAAQRRERITPTSAAHVKE